MLAYESHQSVEGVGAADYLKVEPKGPATRRRPDDDLADRREQTAVDQMLAHEAVSTTHGGDAPIGVFGVGTHEEDLRLRPCLLDASRHLQPVEVRHHQVRDYDVRTFA